VSGLTRYPVILAPNGVIASGSMAAGQAGLDVLESGGTATDAAVASLAVALAHDGLPGPDWTMSFLVASSWDLAPETALATGHDPADALVVWHSLLDRFGTRSLYDLLRPDSGYGACPISVRGAVNDWRPAFESAESLTRGAGLTLGSSETCTIGGFNVFSGSPRIVSVLEAGYQAVTRGSERREAPSLGGFLDALLVPDLGRTRDSSLSVANVLAADHRGMVTSLSMGSGLVAVTDSQLILQGPVAAPAVASVLALSASLGGPAALAQVACQYLNRARTGTEGNSLHHLQRWIEAPRLALPSNPAENESPEVTSNSVCLVEEGFSGMGAARPDNLGEPRDQLGDFHRGLLLRPARRWDPRLGIVQAIGADRRHGLFVASADPRGHCDAAGY